MIEEETVPLKVMPLEEENFLIVQRYSQVWTPTILLLAPDGRVYHEWNGYLPPAHYLAQLHLGLGKAALK